MIADRRMREKVGGIESENSDEERGVSRMKIVRRVCFAIGQGSAQTRRGSDDAISQGPKKSQEEQA